MIWLEIDFIAYVEVHAAAYILYDKAVASRFRRFEIYVPDI